MPKYSFSINNDTATGVVNNATLFSDISSSSITIALDYINTSNDDLDIWFKASLSEEEYATLSGVVSDHTGLYTDDTVPHMDDGRPIVRADSRPIGHTTMFTMAGDTASGIGDGSHLEWDFSNDTNLVASGIETPYGTKKMKRVSISFLDPVYIKEGCLYFHDAKKGSYVDCSVVCPAGAYYRNRDGTPAYASEDTVVVRYANKHHFAGTAAMGDELNTESATETPLPPGYKLCLDVYVPESDNDSFGYGEFELYRERSYLLPGEAP